MRGFSFGPPFPPRRLRQFDQHRLVVGPIDAVAYRHRANTVGQVGTGEDEIEGERVGVTHTDGRRVRNATVNHFPRVAEWGNAVAEGRKHQAMFAGARHKVKVARQQERRRPRHRAERTVGGAASWGSARLQAGLVMQFAQALNLRRALSRREIFDVSGGQPQGPQWRIERGLERNALHAHHAVVRRPGQGMAKYLPYRVARKNHVAEQAAPAPIFVQHIGGQPRHRRVPGQALRQADELVAAVAARQVAKPAANFLETEDVGVGNAAQVGHDAVEAACQARSAAALDVPGDEFHAPPPPGYLQKRYPSPLRHD